METSGPVSASRFSRPSSGSWEAGKLQSFPSGPLPFPLTVRRVRLRPRPSAAQGRSPQRTQFAPAPSLTFEASLFKAPQPRRPCTLSGLGALLPGKEPRACHRASKHTEACLGLSASVFATGSECTRKAFLLSLLGRTVTRQNMGHTKNMRIRLLSQRFGQPRSGRPEANWKRQSSARVGSDSGGI